jgi:hypothetical protein
MSWLDDISAIRENGPTLWESLVSVIERDIQEFNKSADSDPKRTITFQRSLPHGLLVDSPFFPRQLLVWLDLDKHGVLFTIAPDKEFVGTLHIRVLADKNLCLWKEDKLLSLDEASHLLLRLILTEAARGQAL